MDLPEDVTAYYDRGGERDRLSRGGGRLEVLRTLELLGRWLPPAPAVILDVGGAAGRYALPLAEAGYQVHLVDPVPLHVEQAGRASTHAQHPLASVTLGDARALSFPDECADAVLLLGPLYHLTGRAERVAALGEAARVLRPGGVVVAAAISRWASTADGFLRGLMGDAQYAAVAAEDVATGVHRNPERRPGWFTTAYFHRPEDLTAEIADAGLVADGPVAVEGLAGLAEATGDLDALLEDPAARTRVMEAVRAAEREPALLGASAHLLIAGRRPPAPAGPVQHGSIAGFRGVLLDWRGTLVVAPTYPWLVRTALQRLGREVSPGAVQVVLDQLGGVDDGEVAASAIDIDAGLHREAHARWFTAAGVDDQLARELYAVESEASLNPFADDVGPLLRGLHAAGVRIGVVSDIHVDLRPVFAAQVNPDGSTWADLVTAWALSYELGIAKPDPAIFTAALDRLGLGAQEVLMVGDRATHDGAAAEVGMTTLLLPPLRATNDLRLHRVLDLVLPR